MRFPLIAQLVGYAVTSDIPFHKEDVGINSENTSASGNSTDDDSNTLSQTPYSSEHESLETDMIERETPLKRYEASNGIPQWKVKSKENTTQDIKNDQEGYREIQKAKADDLSESDSSTVKQNNSNKSQGTVDNNHFTYQGMEKFPPDGANNPICIGTDEAFSNNVPKEIGQCPNGGLETFKCDDTDQKFLEDVVGGEETIDDSDYTLFVHLDNITTRHKLVKNALEKAQKTGQPLALHLTVEGFCKKTKKFSADIIGNVQKIDHFPVNLTINYTCNDEDNESSEGAHGKCHAISFFLVKLLFGTSRVEIDQKQLDEAIENDLEHLDLYTDWSSNDRMIVEIDLQYLIDALRLHLKTCQCLDKVNNNHIKGEMNQEKHEEALGKDQKKDQGENMLMIDGICVEINLMLLASIFKKCHDFQNPSTNIDYVQA